VARPIESQSRPRRRKQTRALSLISPITPRARRSQARKVVFHGAAPVVRKTRQAPIAPSRVVSTHRNVTAKQADVRAARHGRRLKAHRQRVAIKKGKEADRGQFDRQRAALTEHYNPQIFKSPTGLDPLGRGHKAPEVGHLKLGHVAKFLSGVGGKTAEAGLNVELASSGGTHVGAGKVLDRLAVQTPKALLEHPSAIPKTLKGLALLPAAIPAAAVETVAHPKRTVSAMFDDIGKRYFKETDQQFRDRIGKQGATAEVTDALAIGAPASALAGRGVTTFAREVLPKSRAARFLTEDRPALRVSGGTTHAQDLSPNAFRAIGQRAEDAIRGSRVERRNARRPEHKPGLQPETGEVVPLFQKRAQRIAASEVQSPHYHAAADERAREVNRGVHKALNRLNRRQRHAEHGAVGYAVQGMVPLSDPVKAVKMLKARRERIVAEYHAQGFTGEPREVKTIDYLITHAGDVFNEDLAKFHAAEAARHERVGHVGTGDLTAEVRKRRPQADELHVAYDYELERNAIETHATVALKRAKDANDAAEIKRVKKEALAKLEDRKPQIDQEFIAKVDQAAAKEGLPEPLYMEHFKHRTEAESKMGYTVGQARAMPAPKESRMVLHRSGRADTRPIAYVQSVARTIRRKHNWRLVADAADAHSFRLPDDHELEQVFGHRHVDPEQLTTDEWKTVLTHRGVDERDYAFWAPGRFRREVVDHASTDSEAHLNNGEIDSAEVQQAAGDSLVPADKVPQGLREEKGVRLLPRAVHDEIHSAVKDSSVLGRAWGKGMGLMSAVILANPTFVPVQTAANAFVAAVGVKGSAAAFFKAPVFWHRLTPEQRQMADELFGTGVGEAHGRNVHIGAAANNRFIDGYRALREALAYKTETVKNAVPLVRNLPTLNPIHAMFALDNVQNRYFKRVVLYNEVKRATFRDMANHGGEMWALQDRITHLLDLGPQERMRAIIDNPELIRKYGRVANDFLGDYARYTARERRYLKRNILFYGFLRYSVRTLFYTLPIKHPITLAAAAKLSDLHRQEVMDLLGGDEAPWAFSKLYTDVRYDKGKGKFLFNDPKHPQAIDLARINPVTNPIVDSLSSGDPKAFSGFLSPAAQVALNQVYGLDAFTHRQYQPNESRWRIAADEALSIVFPYRVGKQITQPGPSKYYQADSLLGFPRLKKYKTKPKQREQRQAIANAGTPLDILKQQVVPFFPRPDTSKQAAENRRKATKKKPKKGGGNLFAPTSGGSNGSF
jgi:hypothetical protein